MDKDYSLMIFDLDGTLIDSISVWEYVDIRWLKIHGITPTKEILDDFKTMDFSDAVIYAKTRLGIKEEKDVLFAEWTEMVFSAYSNDILLKPFAKEILEKYKREGKKLYLATSCQKDCCFAVLKNLGIESYFEKIFFTQDIGKGKAFPDIYEECVKASGISRDKVLVFDDIYDALVSSHMAGLDFCCVYDEKTSKPLSLLKEKSDYFIESFKELL